MIVLGGLFRNDWDSPGPQAARAPEMMRWLFWEGCSGMIGTRLEHRLLDDDSCVITLQHTPRTPRWGQCTIAVFLVTSGCRNPSLPGQCAPTHGYHCLSVVVRESYQRCGNETDSSPATILANNCQGSHCTHLCLGTWRQNKSICWCKNVMSRSRLTVCHLRPHIVYKSRTENSRAHKISNRVPSLTCLLQFRSRVDPRKECESCGNARFRERK
jgi:hypothetical protein